MRHSFIYCAIALIISACSSKSSQSDAPVETLIVVEHDADAQSADDAAIKDALKSRDSKKLKSITDKLALNADDLTPAQAASVLAGFYELHLKYESGYKRKSDMETMRKFVDVYDIVNSNHGNDFRKALTNDSVDYTQVYRDFVDRLSQNDNVILSDVAPADTIPADTLPPELRPAE